jgi:hypothetical protein
MNLATEIIERENNQTILNEQQQPNTQEEKEE